jgi:peptidoglycan hydrolase CwlO-like protein
LKIDLSDKESNELQELEEQLQGAYKQIDEIQNRIDEIFIGAKNTPDETTDTDNSPQHIPGESA